MPSLEDPSSVPFIVCHHPSTSASSLTLEGSKLGSEETSGWQGSAMSWPSTSSPGYPG
ncbi:hypothetical protein KSP40_PGU001397 [Platanthera guangdongensis]|uniref:Uncharacterized protein n=1 Tax=Platanthera guangdongensis TaxID=2320717 RepID=A0ABR2LT46_9ASPA